MRLFIRVCKKKKSFSLLTLTPRRCTAKSQRQPLREDPVRVHTLPEGHHEQHSGHQGDPGAPRGPDDSCPVPRARQALGHVRGREAPRRGLSDIERQPQEGPRRDHDERRVQRQGQVHAHRSGIDEQAERVAQGEFHVVLPFCNWAMCLLSGVLLIEEIFWTVTD